MDTTSDNLPLFAYGTLRRGLDAKAQALMADACIWRGYATMPGSLYDLGDYPGATTTQSGYADLVHGELYQFKDMEALYRLDEYEECAARFAHPHEFVRQIITVVNSQGGMEQAWAYLYNWPVDTVPRITSGDFLSHRLGKQT